jgi:dihydroorotate dehydrogenase electron transfer subunit
LKLDNMQVVVLENKRVIGSYFKMRLSYDGVLNALPGQFIMMKVNNSYDPLLSRPMSFHRIISPNPSLEKGGRGKFEILYQVVGKGTGIMSGLKEGAKIDILGPLGRGFLIPDWMDRAIIIAGGMGVAPMMALAEEISRHEVKKSKISISVFMGVKTKDDILCREDFERIGAEVYVSTEDGSLGKKGTCVDLLKELMTDTPLFSPPSEGGGWGGAIFACGPQGMLKAIAGIAMDKKILCQVSLDKRMACGTGACLGCVIKVRSQKYACVCKDGPVFDAGEINWEML